MNEREKRKLQERKEKLIDKLVKAGDFEALSLLGFSQEQSKIKPPLILRPVVKGRKTGKTVI